MTKGRRTFIKNGMIGAASMMLPSFEFLPQTPPVVSQPGFSLKVMGTKWGNPDPIDLFCQKVKEEGYDGIEVWWPGEQKDQEALFEALKKNKLDIGFLCGGSQADYASHFASFKSALQAAAFNKFQTPLYINCHSGRDYFSSGENKTFIDLTSAVAKESGVRIMHETHRSRMLFAAPVARNYILERPDLRITLDISHWCNVSESLLQDQKDTVNMTLQRTDHIHARVGHAEGPQVNDPRAPEWETAVKAHFDWWDQVVARKKENGEPLTFLTEFGPPHYMPTVPYTNQPVADQWAINVHMMQTLRKRYLV